MLFCMLAQRQTCASKLSNFLHLELEDKAEILDQGTGFWLFG
jgi:hypothetical protein